MKRLTTNLAIIAMILGSSLAFAFKAPTPAKTNSPQNWYYTSGSPTNPADYTLTPQPCPSGTAHICDIVANAEPSNPNLPEIDAGLASRINSKDTSMGDVFLKR